MNNWTKVVSGETLLVERRERLKDLEVEFVDHGLAEEIHKLLVR
jgi:hypothetical protein